MAILRSLIVSLVARTDNFEQGMRKAEGSLRGFRTATTQFQGQIRGLTTELLKFSAAQAGIGTVLDVVRKGFQAGLTLEQVHQGLLNITGSSAAAKQSLLMLEELARQTGLSFTALAGGFTAMQTAARGTTLSFEDVTRIFQQFMRAAGAAGIPAEGLANILGELTEILNQQTITMRDFTPLLKQFPGLIDAAARAMGVTRAEFEQMAASGELLTTVVLPRLAEQLGTTTTQNVKPLTTAVESLSTAWDELWRTITKTGIVDVMTKGLTGLTQAVKDLDAWIKTSMTTWERWNKVLSSGVLGALLKARFGVLGELVTPSTAEAPGTGGLAPGQPRPGDVVPPAEGPPAPATPPAVDTARQREIERLEQEIDRRSQQLDALLKRANERMQQFPRDAQRIVEETAAAAEKLIQETETLLLQLERSLRELGQQGQKTQTQASKTAEAISPQRAAVRARLQELAPQYGLDPRLVEALIKRESNFDPRAVSKAGAQGLMQLMPATARALGVTDPFDIEQNLRGGMKLLSDLLKQFNGDMDKALAAYNAGPARVLKGGTLPKETREFVPAVQAEYERLKASGAGAMDATAAGATTTTERLTKLTDQLSKTRQQLDDMRTAAAALQVTQDRIVAEDRYIDLLIETQNEVNALTMTEDELARTSLERMQRQAAARRDLQNAMRKDAAGVSAIVREELARSLAEKSATQQRVTAEDRYIELLLQTRQEVDALALSEDELARTSLERLQQQMEAQRQWQRILRANPQAGAELLRGQVDLAQEQRNRLSAQSAIAEMEQGQRQGVNELVSGLQEQVRVLTLTNRQYLEYQLNLRNATDGEIAQTLALQDKVEMLQVSREAADTVTDALIDMAVTGEISLKSLQQTFSRMVLTMMADALKIRETLTKLLQKGLEVAINALPSAPGGTATAAEAGARVEGLRAQYPQYAGGLQHGGAVVPGRFYTVGENGPELLVAGSAGTVVPGGARPITIVQNIQTPDAESFRRSGPQIAAQMVTAAQRARRVM